MTSVKGERRKMPLGVLMIIPETPARLVFASGCGEPVFRSRPVVVVEVLGQKEQVKGI